MRVISKGTKTHAPRGDGGQRQAPAPAADVDFAASAADNGAVAGRRDQPPMSTAATPYQVVLDPKAYEGIRLLEEDGVPMETILHRDCMYLLIELVKQHNRERRDFFVGGNNFIYFNPDQARNLDYRGPDFFYVKDGVDYDRERRYWAVWEEGGRLPDVIIELISPTTEEEDRTTKFVIYEQTMRTMEYFLYDPFTHVLEGFRLTNGVYRPLAPNKRGRIWSEELGLWLGPWEGEYMLTHQTYLRMYTPNGKLVPTVEEYSRRRVDTAQRRAEAAEQEAARLKAILAQLTAKPHSSGRE